MSEWKTIVPLTSIPSILWPFFYVSRIEVNHSWLPNSTIPHYMICCVSCQISKWEYSNTHILPRHKHLHNIHTQSQHTHAHTNTHKYLDTQNDIDPLTYHRQQGLRESRSCFHNSSSHSSGWKWTYCKKCFANSNLWTTRNKMYEYDFETTSNKWYICDKPQPPFLAYWQNSLSNNNQSICAGSI